MYSTAFNLTTSLSGGVSPQTGLFSPTFNFGEVSSYSGFGPSFLSGMQFDPLSTLHDAGTGSPPQDNGLGTGWSFRLPGFDFATKKLTTPEGTTLSVVPAWVEGATWTLTNHPLHNLRVQVSDNRLHLQHKDCSVMILDRDPVTDGAFPYAFVDPNGRTLWFSGRDVQGRWRLESIQDDSGTPLLSVQYASQSRSNRTVVELYPGTSGVRRYELYISPDDLFLEQVVQPDGTSMTFSRYGEPVGPFTYIGQVTCPSGMTESVEYETLITMPAGAPVPSLYAVSRHILQTDQQVVQTFEYDPEGSGHCVWGTGSGENWQDHEDSLEYYTGDYRYTTRVTRGETVVTQTWNKFHQLRRVSSSHDGGLHVIEKEIVYYSNDEAVLDEQDIRYQLPVSETTRFLRYATPGSDTPDESSPAFTLGFEYDEYGNLLSERSVDGTTVTTAFWDGTETGELPEGCVVPAHPFDMVSLPRLRSETGAGGEVREVRYFYQAFPDITGDGVLYLPKRTEYADTVIIEAYHNAPGMFFHAELEKQIVQKGSGSLTRETGYSTGQEGQIVTVVTLNTHDRLQVITRTEHDPWHGLLLSETNEDGVVTRYTYDASGRPSLRVYRAESAYETRQILTYQPAPLMDDHPFPGWCVTLQAEPSGRLLQAYILHQEQDTLLRTLWLSDAQGIMRKIRDCRYDLHNREVSDERIDWFEDTPVARNVTLTEYDVWGQPATERTDTGEIRVTESNPFSLTRRRWRRHPTGRLLELPEQETFNLFRQVVRLTRHDSPAGDAGLYSEMSLDYDGLGRLLAHADALGHTTHIGQRDDYDRPLSVTFSDGTRLETAYHDFLTDLTPETLTLYPAAGDAESGVLSPGSTICDGLGRVTERTSHDIRHVFHYPDAAASEQLMSAPYEKINGRNQTLTMTYETALGMPSSQTCATDSRTDRFVTRATTADAAEHYPPGSIKSVSHGDGSGKTEYTYNALGQPQTVAHTIPGAGTLHVEYLRQRLSGQPESTILTLPDGTQETLTLRYDPQGRPTGWLRGSLQASMDYDLLGRPHTFRVQELSGDILQKEETRYDEYGRPDSITVETPDARVIWTYDYDVRDKITCRNTLLIQQSAEHTLQENYRYDARGHLTHYTAVASHDDLLSRDETGQPVLAQTWTWLSNSRIHTLETAYASGLPSVSCRYHYQGMQLTSVTRSSIRPEHNDLTTFSYDGDGNIRELQRGPDEDSMLRLRTMEYDALNRLLQADCDGQRTTEYVYDGLGQLIRAGALYRFYHNGRAELDWMDDTRWTQYLRFAGRPVAEHEPAGDWLLGCDLAGTPLLVTDTAGRSVFGNYSPAGWGKSSCRTGFTGELRDDELQAYHTGMRTYHLIPGQFGTQDPLSPFDEGGLNGYGYCGGDPVNMRDPSGNIAVSLLVAAAMAVPQAMSRAAQAHNNGRSTGAAVGMALGVIAVSVVLGLISGVVGKGARKVRHRGTARRSRTVESLDASRQSHGAPDSAASQNPARGNRITQAENSHPSVQNMKKDDGGNIVEGITPSGINIGDELRSDMWVNAQGQWQPRLKGGMEKKNSQQEAGRFQKALEQKNKEERERRENERKENERKERERQEAQIRAEIKRSGTAAEWGNPNFQGF